MNTNSITTRLRPVVEAIAKLGGEDGKSTADIVAETVVVLREHGVTRGDFWELDEHPGLWGYRTMSDKEWHWRVRRVRNHHSVLDFTKEAS